MYEPEVSVSRWTVSELQGASATNAIVFTGRIVGKDLFTKRSGKKFS